MRLPIEQAPECALLRVIGARRVARGRSDPTILLLDEIGNAQIFLTTVTPFFPHPLVQALGEGFCQAISDGLRHDRVVVVILRPEPVAQLLQADPTGYRERTDMIGKSLFPRGDKAGDG